MTNTASTSPSKASIFQAPGMLALLGIVGLGFANFSLLLPATPTWAHQGGASESQTGAVTLILMVATILTQTQVNRFLAKLGWGKSFALALLFLTLPAALQAVSPVIWLVMLTSALRGVGFGLLTVCGSTAITRLVPTHQYGKAVGAYGLVIAGPQFVLSSAAPAVVDALGARAVLLASTLSLVGLFLTSRVGGVLDSLALADQQGEADTPGKAGGTFVLIWASLLGLFLVTATGGALLTFAPQIALTPALATGSLLMLTGLAAPARWLMGSLSDRMNLNLLILIQGLMTAVGTALLGYSVVTGGSALWILLGSALLGIAYGGLQSVTMVKAFADAGKKRTAQASVFWNITFDAGTGAGSMILGVLAQSFGFSTALYLMAAAALLATLISVARGVTLAGQK